MEPHAPAAPFLVLSHHRSGSNFVNDLVQAHPCAECINEPFSMHSAFFRECDLEPWALTDFHPRWLHRRLVPHDELRGFLSELRCVLQHSHPRRVIGFKETGLFGKLGWLKAFIPRLRVIFVRRDPRAIVSSVLRSGLLDLWRYRELVPRAFRAQWPGLRCPDPADPALRDAQLVAMSVAVRWRLAQRSLGLFEHHVLPLEACLQDPQPHLERLCAFLGLAPHPEQVAFLRHRQGDTRGGLYSSFRAREAVQTGWRAHLSEREVDAVDAVLHAADTGTPSAVF